MKISSEWPLSFSFHTVWFNSAPPRIAASKMTKTCDSPSLQFVRQWNTGMYDILQVCNHIIQHLHGQRLTLNLPYSKCYFAMIVHNGFYIWMFDSSVLFPIFLLNSDRPKDVKVQASRGFTVTENETLRLTCDAHSHPETKSYRWMKITDGKSEIMNHRQTQTITIQSVSPSDSGLYSCAASNEIGTGESQPAEVLVKCE